MAEINSKLEDRFRRSSYKGRCLFGQNVRRGNFTVGNRGNLETKAILSEEVGQETGSSQEMLGEMTEVAVGQDQVQE